MDVLSIFKNLLNPGLFAYHLYPPRLKIKFQGEALPKTAFSDYARMHTKSEEVCLCMSDRWSVCVVPSEDGFEQVSFVNGICTTKGGSHVDHVAGILASNIIDEMAKKIKLKPQQVKNSFMVFIRATLVNPTFSNQV